MRAAWVLAMGLAVLVLVGCGGGSSAETSATKDSATKAPPEKISELQEVIVSLEGWEGPGTVGLLMAEKHGYWTEAGLRVITLAPESPRVVIPDVLSGSDAFGISHEPQVVMAQEKGAPIVIVGSLIPEPTAAMIWLKKSQIGGIADLKGKTIGIPGLPFQKSFLQSVLAQGGLKLSDVKVESVGNDSVPDLASGRVDAIFGTSNVEGVDLESRGLEPVITPVKNLGIPPYDELVLIARKDKVAEDPQLVQSVMSAISRGTAAALEDPEYAAHALKKDVEVNPETSLEATEAEIEATLPLLSKDGEVNPEQASGLIDWMYEEGMIQKKVPVATLSTDAYRSE